MGEAKLHIAMYPWFAIGHLTPFLHLANKLAKKGHNISFFIPTKTQAKFEHLNFHPTLITFLPITVPHVEGLPPGAETTFDVPPSLNTLIATAMDRTEPIIRHMLKTLKPHIIFYDLAPWLPGIARPLGIKSVHYCVASTIAISYLSAVGHLNAHELTEADYMVPPTGFPDPTIKLHLHEARELFPDRSSIFGNGKRFLDRILDGINSCDALGFASCREIEQIYIEYMKRRHCGKPILLSGPVIPMPLASTLDEKWMKWLGGFKAGTVIYCALGSECTMQKDQFQELLLGLELTGLPFLAALKPPFGTTTVDEALPEKLEERVRGRGIVHGGWVQQQLILQHQSIGCFITHCGWNSVTEALISKCQFVLLPQVGDQTINARMMSKSLKVGVEVEKGEEDGSLTKEAVCEAVKTVMDEGNEHGKEVRANHSKIREVLLDKKLESSYLDCLEKDLKNLLK